MTSRLFCLVTETLLYAITGAAPVRAAEPVELVAQAIEKMGGAKSLAAIETLSIAARQVHWDPQGTYEPDVDTRLGGESRFTLSMDIAHDRARTDWVRYRIAPM